MATPLRWYAPTALQTLLQATDLQSLANNTSVLGAEYDNTAAGTLDMVADLLFAIQYAVITGISAGVRVADVYLLPKTDGTNYPTQAGSPSVPQRRLWVGSLESRNPSTSALEYLSIPGVVLPPTKFKLLLANISGQALHGSAAMFAKAQPYQQQAG